jgi:AcrR family transcriptional regulator
VRSGSPTSHQYRRTIFVALSIESDPPLVRKTFASGIGAIDATREVSASVGGFVRSPKVEYEASSAICAPAASAISLRPCPTLQNHSPAVASTYLVPWASQTYEPSPRTRASAPVASTAAIAAKGCQKLVITRIFAGRDAGRTWGTLLDRMPKADGSEPADGVSAVDGRMTDTRERILVEASNLFAVQGYHGTTTREIADAVGIRQPSLFHHFRTKGEILQALLASDLDTALPMAEAIADSGASAAERLHRFLVEDIGLLARSPYNLSGLYTDEAMADPDFADWIDKNRRFEGAIERIVREGIEHGEFVPMDPTLARHAITGILIRTLSLYSGPRPVPQGVDHEIASFVLRALGASPPSGRGVS